MVVIVLAVTGGAVCLLRYLMYGLSAAAGIITDGILFYYAIAPKSLYLESMAVCRALASPGKEAESGPDLGEARRRLSMIVGRDTERLTEAGIIRAAVETVAENTSDGVTAPMLYMAAGGPVLCFLYKAVNTMDSMVGYHNETFEYFGRAAARTDDIWNYIPARLTAFVMLLTVFFPAPAGGGMLRGTDRRAKRSRKPYCQKGLQCTASGNETKKTEKIKNILKKAKSIYNFDAKNCMNNSDNSRNIVRRQKKYAGQNIKQVLFIYRRDRGKHKSPNSAQTESVCAGILGIRLAGDASYFGRTVQKPYIGDDLRPPCRQDILWANALMYETALIMMALLAICRLLVVNW